LNLRRLSGMARSLAIYRGIPGRAARLRCFYESFVAAGDLCFDIGAHVGNHTRCWRQLGARVVAVEPQADFARLLRTLHRRDAGVTVLQVAVGQAPGRAMLRASARTPTVSSLSAAWIDQVSADPSFAQVAWTEPSEVAVTTLNDMIVQFGMPKFVKIDVEGFELPVLQGLNCAVPALSFEVLPIAREAARACIDRLIDIADYEFNWSFGEQYRFDQPGWIGAPAMCGRLRALATGSRSGDIYARLRAATS
jgi:FkbM family methyltransferase